MGWAPEKIQAELIIRRKSQTNLAKQLGVSVQSVNKVIKNQMTSRRIRKKIAKEIGTSVKEIWPAA